jgi:hypothetical protein
MRYVGCRCRRALIDEDFQPGMPELIDRRWDAESWTSNRFVFYWSYDESGPYQSLFDAAESPLTRARTRAFRGTAGARRTRHSDGLADSGKRRRFRHLRIAATSTASCQEWRKYSKDHAHFHPEAEGKDPGQKAGHLAAPSDSTGTVIAI